MQEGFALTALLCLILNLIIPEEIEDEETPELTADVADVDKDNAEWGRLHSVAQPRKASHDNAAGPMAEKTINDTSTTNGHDVEKRDL
jgi:uric acid-xanthine permease